MTRSESRYVCQSCGAAFPRWAGRCDACGAWNTVTEEQPKEAVPKGLGRAKGRLVPFVPLSSAQSRMNRLETSIAEFDRVFGGGMVVGSAILLAGDPGIGKSTLLLQAAAALANRGLSCIYVSGEEGIDQIRLRAERLGFADSAMKLAAATGVRDVLTSLEAESAPDVVVIDSIQTMYLDMLDSAPGTVAQVRGSAQELIRFAKRSGAVLLVVGHVTKEGQIAGPRVLEHMVDTVLYFEGERGHQFRIVRAIKNRFGPTDEIGVFEMTGAGLIEVPNPSSLFLSAEHQNVSGTAVFAGIEGTRPVLVEIQALVAPAPPGSPRRTVVGWDAGRLAMVLAVLDARAGLRLSGSDIYLNVAGGLRIAEPAADLAVAAALVSSSCAQPVPEGTVVFGEIGLGGEVRPVSQTPARLKEAAKLGFKRGLAPASAGDGEPRDGSDLGIQVHGIGEVSDLIDIFDSDSPPLRVRS